MLWSSIPFILVNSSQAFVIMLFLSLEFWLFMNWITEVPFHGWVSCVTPNSWPLAWGVSTVVLVESIKCLVFWEFIMSVRNLHRPSLASSSRFSLSLLTSILFTLHTPKTFFMIGYYLLTVLPLNVWISGVAPDGLSVVRWVSTEVGVKSSSWPFFCCIFMFMRWLRSPMLASLSTDSLRLRASIEHIIHGSSDSFLTGQEWCDRSRIFSDRITVFPFLKRVSCETPDCITTLSWVSAKVLFKSFIRVRYWGPVVWMRSLLIPSLACQSRPSLCLNSPILGAFLTPESLSTSFLDLITIFPSLFRITCEAPNSVSCSIWVSAHVWVEAHIWSALRSCCMFMRELGRPFLAYSTTSGYVLWTSVASI